jgi:hypothetical protein
MCLMSNSQSGTESTLRRWVAKREGIADVSEPIWQLIVEDRLVGDWLTEDPELRDKVRTEILDRYRRLKRLVRETGGVVSDTSEDEQEHDSTLLQAELPAGDPVALRAEALCLYWAKLAEADPKVQRFRKDVFGGAAASDTAARNLIHSPAAAVWGLKFFEKRRIPIVGHTAEYLHYEKSRLFETPSWVQATVKITWPGGETVAERRWKGPQEIRTFWDGKELVSIVPWPDSLLQRLYKVATELCRHYPWEAKDAVWLILTGKAPLVPPLTARVVGPDLVRNHGTITITTAHWVPKDAVGRFYAELKGKLNSAPTPSPRRLAVFRFVVENSSGIDRWESSEPGKAKDVRVQGLDTPRWRSLHAQWNKTYPAGDEWHQRDVRHFYRDFTEASKALLGY